MTRGHGHLRRGGLNVQKKPETVIRYSFGYILTITGFPCARSVGLDFRKAFQAGQDANMLELHGSPRLRMILPEGRILL